ncbi:hypothetical protein OD350_28980 (plasmid) [Clostridium beijerinckii]|uniref:hypothetical protein n=1 Tax=Clostridium beijerinckii TaxID=1520 RepID=UPI002225E50A|nr:hypothetical protein [Clostridium beijerinckii]UYZ39109.1 hypothetical protein OD350_28980 [Clostridium beijerinckii]
MSDINKLQGVGVALSVLMSMLIILIIITNNTKKNKRMVELGNKIFNSLSELSLLRNRLFNLRTRIYNNTLDEDWLIRYKVILYTIMSWIVGLMTAIVVVIFFKNNLYVTCTLLFFSYQVKEMFLDILIGNDTPFLTSLFEYGVELQQAFNLTKDARTAIREANVNSSNYNLVKRMEEVERLIDDPIELELYLQECPNDYLKLLILNCSLVAEHGDKKDVDDKSVFLENIFYNNENIEAEIFKRKQLEFWLRGLKMLCIIPLLSFSPYEQWVSTYMKLTDVFYKSTMGFLVKLTITFIAIALFYIISGYEKSYRTKSKDPKEEYWEDKLCKIKAFRQLVVKLSPKANSARAYRYRMLISNSGEFITIEHIFIQKIIFAVAGFIVIFSILFSMHQINRSCILNNITESKELNNSVTVTKKGQDEIVNIEKGLFQYVNDKDIEGSYNIISKKVQEQGITVGGDYIVKDVITKQIKVINEGVSIIDFIISMIGVVIGYIIPEFILKAKYRYRKQEMENEIIIFETIILIFMYHEHGTSELILENMAKFANIFKPQVESVLKEIKKSDFEALKILVEDIKYKPFLNIVKNLIKAENIKTKEAFISLSDNRRNYLQNRREDNRQIVHKRVNNARALSLITLDLIIGAYIALPLLYISNVQVDKTQSQIIETQTKQ